MNIQQEQILIAKTAELEKELAAKNRELEIEAALERVRARTMAMFKTDELNEVVFEFFNQMNPLGFAQWGFGLLLVDETKQGFNMWFSAPGGRVLPESYYLPKLDHRVSELLWSAYNNQLPVSYLELEDEEKLSWDLLLFEKSGYRTLPDNVKNEMLAIRYVMGSLVSMRYGLIEAIDVKPLPGELIIILQRFAKVFEQTYTRFLDLQKAETQAREAQIEVALERVRAGAMAMHHSGEIPEVAHIIWQQLAELKLADFDGCAILVLDEEGTNTYDSWYAFPETVKGDQHVMGVTKYAQDCAWVIKEMFAKYRAGESEIIVEMNPEQINEFLDWVELDNPALTKEIRGMNLQQLFLYAFPYSNGVVTSYAFKNLRKETSAVLKRITGVFDMAYRRFQDLQKAEAQARESQIQLALERVRASTMAMQHSSELREIAAAVHDQILGLGFTSGFCSIVIMDRISGDMTWWMFFPGKEYPESYHMPYCEHPFYLAQLNNWKQGEKYSVIEVSGEEKKSYDKYTFSQTEFVKIPIENQQFMMSFEKIIFSNAYMKHGAFSWGVEQIDDEHSAVLQRFASVFDQCYTRFLDLQKAEAQARESQIEAALERVRSRTMAMQHSSELADAAMMLFQQMQPLNIPAWSTGYCIWEDDKQAANFWMSSEGLLQSPFKLPLTEEPVCIRYREAHLQGEAFYAAEYSGEKLASMYAYMMNFPAVSNMWNRFMDEGTAPVFPTFQINHVVYFAQGFLLFVTHQHIPEAHDIFKRFGKIFEQTYTRFLDLQKAEAQAREAIKRASVDRVRAEIASMRTTSDLERIQPLLWNELKTLGVPFIRCGVFIMDEEQQQVQTHLSKPDGKSIAAFRLPYDATEQTKQIVAHWQKKQLYKDHMDEAAFDEYTKNLVLQGAVSGSEKFVTENHPTDLYLHFLPFLQGMLYAGNDAPLQDDELQLVQNLADAFSTAYARYEDFNKLEAAKQTVDKTLTDLKQTQVQLVQSEKMASLGELTAGIAHEIQNPLNFVNNFSEVSSELIDEMNEEIAKGNLEDAKQIAEDLKQNLKKINHHGKRAGDIVKGMLQHSRSSSGVKEPTDINKLADEYLRLAYHGLRAKDKSFNATMNTDYDQSIGNINVIPQDIGRVILNLITNAFYACTERSRSVVDEKKKQNPTGYEPTVSLSTKKENNKVLISVKDNGNGIPQKVLDKIFQPFFTTKPTGQGTGLGLSLSYDIVKSHGGEIKVESKEGVGSEFCIVLPA